jgi:cytochrome d ubiquinol oxidase subunit II
MLELLVAGALVASLVFYVLTGGADFGGGVFDLLARGPRAERKRALIARAIGPIWEANHVWLILALVILFTGFPKALAAIATTLHGPITLMLFGIVLRGTAFIFRAHDSAAERRWARAFAVASAITPVILGAIAGTLLSGGKTWLAPFPLSCGALTLALFTYLAATYLAVEAREPDLRESFARSGIVAAVLVLALGVLVHVLGAAELMSALRERRGAWLGPALAALVTLAGILALSRGRVYVARALAALLGVIVVLGWALVQYPYLVPASGITIQDAAAPRATLALLVGALAAGAFVLFPSLAYLYRVFKGHHAFDLVDRETRRF